MKFHKYPEKKPKNGQLVLWIWADSGQITSGDFWNGKPRETSNCYGAVEVSPSHWSPWPRNWPVSGIKLSGKVCPHREGASIC